jgi:dATP pyrophosphohydrolase
VAGFVPEKEKKLFPVIADGVAVYVFRVIAGKYEFLQLKRSDDDDTYGQSWHPVYGGAESGETAAEAARRELIEETGLVPEQMILIEYLETFYFRLRNSIQMLPVFAARVQPDVVIRLNHEHSDFRWIPQSEISGKFVWRSQRQALAVVLETLEEFADRLPLLEV